jgi:hypothetical protein
MRSKTASNLTDNNHSNSATMLDSANLERQLEMRVVDTCRMNSMRRVFGALREKAAGRAAQCGGAMRFEGHRMCTALQAWRREYTLKLAEIATRGVLAESGKRCMKTPFGAWREQVVKRRVGWTALCRGVVQFARHAENTAFQTWRRAEDIRKFSPLFVIGMEEYAMVMEKAVNLFWSDHARRELLASLATWRTTASERRADRAGAQRVEAWWARRARSRAWAALREAKEEPGGGPTMTVFKNKDRVKVFGASKHTGEKGRILRVMPKKLQIQLEDGTVHHVEKRFVRLEEAQADPDTTSLTSFKSLAGLVGDAIDAVEGVVSSGGDNNNSSNGDSGDHGDAPSDRWKVVLAALLLALAALLQVFAADLLGECSTGETGELDASLKSCRLWSYPGNVTATFYSQLCVIAATLLWQSTQLVRNNGVMLGRTITHDTLWRVVHRSYTFKCFMECAFIEGKNLPFTVMLCGFMVYVSRESKLEGPMTECASSDFGVEYHSAWCAPAYNGVTALQLATLLGLGSLAEEGSVAVCVVLVVYMNVGECTDLTQAVYDRLVDLMNFVRRLMGEQEILSNMESAITPYLERDGDSENSRVSALNLFNNLTATNREDTDRMMKQKQRHHEETMAELRKKDDNRWPVFFKTALLGLALFCATQSVLHQQLGLVEVGDANCRGWFWNDATNAPGLLSENSMVGTAFDGWCQITEPVFGGQTSFDVKHPHFSGLSRWGALALFVIGLFCLADGHKYTAMLGAFIGHYVVGYLLLILVRWTATFGGLVLEFIVRSMWSALPYIITIALRLASS